MKTLTLPAYAKLNLTLDILRKRPDGYHEMEMVMQTISLHDDVTVALEDGEDVRCRIEGAELPTDERNLAVKAAHVFFRETGLPMRGVSLSIVKRIPMQAGMAGGSADAAAVLRALRTLLLPDLSLEETERLGALIGSDVPFCVRGGTVLAQGRGEVLTTLRPAPRLWTVVCKPDFPISTPMLFSRVQVEKLTARPDTAAMLRALEAGDAALVCAQVRNVFEEVLPEECGAVFRIKERLLREGARSAAMTGSGPTVFGLFAARDAAEQAAKVLRGDYRETFAAEFL